MRNKLEVIVLLPLLAAFCCASPRVAPGSGAPPALPLVPLPASVQSQSGYFMLDSRTKIEVDPSGAAAEIAGQLADHINRATGWSLEQSSRSAEKRIILTLNAAAAAAKPANTTAAASDPANDAAARQRESYRLEITPQAILLEAAEPAGLFYGTQTLRQLLPPPRRKTAAIAARPVAIPCIVIEDQPRYRWRGMMLDVSRHFFPKEFIYEFIDYLAMNKLNTFHWHLVDDQGWRIEIKKYPLLTEIGAWRVDRESDHWNFRQPQQPGEKATYGGFYTQAEIRDIVAYARSRFVTIVPEIEMPAHAGAALAAYPHHSCSGGPFTVPPGGVWPIVNIYCAGSDSTFTFLQDILAEVIALFPGEYIHVGGDEADRSEWTRCLKCQTRIRAEKLTNEAELQSYMIRRMEKWLAERGKRLIGWDEILEGGLAPRATVMSWRGMDGGIEAAKQGHDVVMSPTDFCYYDYYQGPPDFEPLSIGGLVPLEKAYAFEPTPAGLNAEQAAHILGCQANLWTEFIATPEHARYMLFPRMLALAEVAWSPAASRSWPSFLQRTVQRLPHLDSLGIGYARTLFNPRYTLRIGDQGRNARIEFEASIPDHQIHYTLDGSDPTAASPLYSGPITLTQSATVKAALFNGEQRQSRIIPIPFSKNRATGKKVTYLLPYSERYKATGAAALVDGNRGSSNYADGNWQGFHENDLEVEIDLGKSVPIKRVASSYLENVGAWIFAPIGVTYSFAGADRVYATSAAVTDYSAVVSGGQRILTFSQDCSGLKARYIKVHAKNVGLCPPGHIGAGDKAWLFADEIIVE